MRLLTTRRVVLPSCCAAFLCAACAATPSLGAFNFGQDRLTDTNDLAVPIGGQVVAAVNFRYAGAQRGASGPVINNFATFDFQDVSPLDGPVALTGSFGGTVDATGAGADSDRSRFQNTANTIGGPDDADLEGVVNTIGFIGFQETSTISFTGLPTGNTLQAIVIGGDAGSGLSNWFGDLQVTANGQVAGVWEAADDDATTATYASVLLELAPDGNLTLDLTNTAPPLPGTNGSFAGYGAVVVILVPEPGALSAAAAVGALALLRRRRRLPPRHAGCNTLPLALTRVRSCAPCISAAAHLRYDPAWRTPA